MFDFCYVANVLLLVHIWVFPHSAFLHKVRLCSAFGRSAPLGFAECFQAMPNLPPPFFVMAVGSASILGLHML